MFPTKLILNYQATPTALKFHASTARMRCLRGPFGSSKTVPICYEIYRLSKKAPHTRWVVIRNTLPELQDSTEKTFFEWFPPEVWGKFTKKPDNYLMRYKHNGQEHKVEVLFRSFDRPEDIKHALGLEITGFFLDEAREIPRAIKQILLGRLRFPRNFPQYSGMMATNPPDIDHYIYNDFVRNPLPNHEIWFTPPEENKLNLPLNYYENMVLEHQDDPEWIKVYVKGEWGCVFEGKAVYPDFNYEFHVSSKPIKPNPKLPLLIGFDFGISTSCAIITQLTPRNWLILDELLQDETQGDFDQFSDSVVEYLRSAYLGYTAHAYSGHEGNIRSITDGKSCIDILRKKAVPVTIGAITEVDRQGAVAKRLRQSSSGKAVVQVDPQCRILIKGFSGGYCRKELKAGIYSDQADKNSYSHIHDALQAIASSVFKASAKVKKIIVNEPYYGSKSLTGL